MELISLSDNLLNSWYISPLNKQTIHFKMSKRTLFPKRKCSGQQEHEKMFSIVSEVAQLCQTLCDPTDCSLPGSSVHGIFQAIVLEWVAISFSRGSSQPRDWTWVSRIVDRCFTIWATREVLSIKKMQIKSHSEILPHACQNSYHQKEYK